MIKDCPEGKALAAVKIGPKGQIVIPKKIRDMFGFKPGDSLLLLADKTQGVALQPFSFAESLWAEITKLKQKEE